MKSQTEGKKIKYYKLESDAMTYIGTKEDIIGHLKEYYFDMSEDWFDNKEVVKITPIKMSDKKFNSLLEWEP